MEENQSQPPVNLKFYRGVKRISEFLDIHPRTTQRLIKENKLPVKRDAVGRWVLCDWDYRQSLAKEAGEILDYDDQSLDV